MNSRFRLITFAASILALSVLSFHGVLDHYAREKVTDTTTETVGIYAVSKAINAGVSVLQTSQVGAIVAQIQLGQLLDPLNDAVERLSGVVVWAIGSLFLQQIILDVAASQVFKWAFLVAGLITLLSLLPMGSGPIRERIGDLTGMEAGMQERLYRGIARVFVIATVIRFIVPVFVGCSFLFSEMLLQSELEKNANELSEMRRAIPSNPDQAIPNMEALAVQRADRENELIVLRKEASDFRKQLDELSAEIDTRKDEAGYGRFVPEFLGGTESDSELGALVERRESLEGKIRENSQEVAIVNEALDCVDRQMEGKRCGSIWERLRPRETKETISKLANSANSYLVSIAKMLIVLFVKNILFPILFVYIAIKFGGVHVIRQAVALKREFRKEAGKARKELDLLNGGDAKHRE